MVLTFKSPLQADGAKVATKERVSFCLGALFWTSKIKWVAKGRKSRLRTLIQTFDSSPSITKPICLFGNSGG